MPHRPCGKYYSTVGNFSQPVCNCSWQACKLYRTVSNFYRLGPRVGKICNRLAVNWNRQAINNNRQACNTNRQAVNCNRQAGNIFESYGLSVSKSVGIKRRVGRNLCKFGLWLVERQLGVQLFSGFYFLEISLSTWARLDWLGMKSVLWGLTFILSFCFLKQAIQLIEWSSCHGAEAERLKYPEVLNHSLS